MHNTPRPPIGHARLRDMHMTKAEPSDEFGQVVTYASDLTLSTPSAILAARLAVDQLHVLTCTTHLRHRACAPVRYAYVHGGTEC